MGKKCSPRQNPGYAYARWAGLMIFWPRNDLGSLAADDLPHDLNDLEMIWLPWRSGAATDSMGSVHGASVNLMKFLWDTHGYNHPMGWRKPGNIPWGIFVRGGTGYIIHSLRITAKVSMIDVSTGCSVTDTVILHVSVHTLLYRTTPSVAAGRCKVSSYYPLANRIKVKITKAKKREVSSFHSIL